MRDHRRDEKAGASPGGFPAGSAARTGLALLLITEVYAAVIAFAFGLPLAAGEQRPTVLQALIFATALLLLGLAAVGILAVIPGPNYAAGRRPGPDGEISTIEKEDG